MKIFFPNIQYLNSHRHNLRPFPLISQVCSLWMLICLASIHPGQLCYNKPHKTLHLLVLPVTKHQHRGEMSQKIQRKHNKLSTPTSSCHQLLIFIKPRNERIAQMPLPAQLSAGRTNKEGDRQQRFICQALRSAQITEPSVGVGRDLKDHPIPVPCHRQRHLAQLSPNPIQAVLS